MLMFVSGSHQVERGILPMLAQSMVERRVCMFATPIVVQKRLLYSFYSWLSKSTLLVNTYLDYMTLRLLRKTFSIEGGD